MKDQLTLAIIPSRGGSKGIKKKNLRRVNGRSLIEITADAAKSSGIFDKIIVSSDSKDILEHALTLGIDVIKRPRSISHDKATSEALVLHVLNKLKNNYVVKDAALLQPTSPLRTSQDIVKSYKKFKEDKANTLVSVNQIDNKFLKLIYRKNNSYKFIEKDFPSMPRQNLPDAYIPNGAIYFFNCKYFKRNPSFISHKTSIYHMNNEASIDIDTEQDLQLVEAIFQRNLS